MLYSLPSNCTATAIHWWYGSEYRLRIQIHSHKFSISAMSTKRNQGEINSVNLRPFIPRHAEDEISEILHDNLGPFPIRPGLLAFSKNSAILPPKPFIGILLVILRWWVNHCVLTCVHWEHLRYSRTLIVYEI